MKALVTGSEGVIGSKLVEVLNDLGYDVVGMDIVKIDYEGYVLGNVNDFASFIPFLDSPPEVVFHLAGEVSNDACEKMPVQTIQSNLIGVLNVLRFCELTGAQLLFTSSSQVYADRCGGDILTEDMVPCYHSGIYGITNWMGEELIRYYHKRYGVQSIIVRLFMCYGPGDFPNRYRSALVRFIEWAVNNEPIIVHSGAVRGWCYIDDMVDGIIAASEYDDGCEVFNIGRGGHISMAELAKCIIEITGSKSDIVYKHAPDHVILKKVASFEKAKRLLNWEAKIPLAEGLEKTIKWYNERRSL